MRKGVFITGTDTAIGKTVVSCCLIKALRLGGIDCGVMKPVQCSGDDSRRLIRCSGINDPLDWVNPFFSKYPYAPLTAFTKEKIRFTKNKVIRVYNKLLQRHQFMVVEGAGGLCVPITKDYFMSDLVLDLNLPVLIVASRALGTINHTLLSVEYARSRKIEILGFIFNDLSRSAGVCEKTNPKIVEQICHLPILGSIPYQKKEHAYGITSKRNIDLDRILNG